MFFMDELNMQLPWRLLQHGADEREVSSSLPPAEQGRTAYCRFLVLAVAGDGIGHPHLLEGSGDQHGRVIHAPHLPEGSGDQHGRVIHAWCCCTNLAWARAHSCWAQGHDLHHWLSHIIPSRQ
ncbi:hypothetical protein Zm00014a_020463 [Zea mays]|uniref:Uncharacterized protein n=1 Tax=Zea mays TaxID=4577 RepID=A0A3L6F3B9_MAIZE|nr:hypothetical protein Zm00014a_020463 [Zea mays]